MAYSDTPLPAERPINSAPLMRQNFANINVAIDHDHIALTDAVNANWAKHKWVRFNTQAAPPGIGAGFTTLFTKTVAGTTSLFWQKFDGGLGGQIIMTGPDPAYANPNPFPPFDPGHTTRDGFSYIPALTGAGGTTSGLLLQWGYGSAVPHSSGPTHIFPRGFSGLPWCIIVSTCRLNDGDPDISLDERAGNITPNAFGTWNSGTNAHQFYYMAIGPA